MQRDKPKFDTEVIIISAAELEEEYQQDATRQKELHPSDPHHWEGFVIDRKAKTIDIWWGGYEYWIDLERFRSPMGLLEWVAHFTLNKTWDGMTSRRIGLLIQTICREKGWKLWRDA